MKHYTIATNVHITSDNIMVKMPKLELLTKVTRDIGVTRVARKFGVSKQSIFLWQVLGIPTLSLNFVTKVLSDMIGGTESERIILMRSLKAESVARKEERAKFKADNSSLAMRMTELRYQASQLGLPRDRI